MALAIHHWVPGARTDELHPAGPATRTAVAASTLQAAVSAGVGHLLPGAVPQPVKASLRWGAADVDPTTLLERHRRRLDGTGPRTLAIYFHGFAIDEHNWLVAGAPVLELEARLGWTPLFVRYHTGHRVDVAARALAPQLAQLSREAGADTSFVLVGHSLGGIVARAVLAELRQHHAEVWQRVRRLVLIGTPNDGLVVEGLVAQAEAALAFVDDLPARAVRQARDATGGSGVAWKAAEALAGFVPVLPGRVSRLHRVLRLRADSLRDLSARGVSAWNGDEVGDHVAVFAVAGVADRRLGPLPQALRTDGVVTVASAFGSRSVGHRLGLGDASARAELHGLLHQQLPAARPVVEAVAGWVERSQA